MRRLVTAAFLAGAALASTAGSANAFFHLLFQPENPNQQQQYYRNDPQSHVQVSPIPREIVAFSGYAPGTVVVNTSERRLYFVLGNGTAIRYGINLVVLVNNNQALSQEFPSLNRNYNGKPYGKSDELWRFSDFNFAKVAEAMGCVGIRVDQPGQIKGALQEAFAVNNKPVVVEVMSDVKEMAPNAWTPQ